MLTRLLAVAPEIFADQVEYHAQLEQDRLLEVAAAKDVMVTAYSPLANGRGLIEQDVVADVAARTSLPWEST